MFCMSHAESIITDQVRERVRRDGVDLRTDRELAGRYVSDAVRRYSERALGGSVPLLVDEAVTTRQIVATLTGFGALQPFFDDPEIEEIWINGPHRVLPTDSVVIAVAIDARRVVSNQRLVSAKASKASNRQERPAALDS